MRADLRKDFPGRTWASGVSSQWTRSRGRWGGLGCLQYRCTRVLPVASSPPSPSPHMKVRVFFPCPSLLQKTAKI